MNSTPYRCIPPIYMISRQSTLTQSNSTVGQPQELILKVRATLTHSDCIKCLWLLFPNSVPHWRVLVVVKKTLSALPGSRPVRVTSVSAPFWSVKMQSKWMVPSKKPSQKLRFFSGALIWLQSGTTFCSSNPQIHLLGWVPPGCPLCASWVPLGCLLGASLVPPGCLLGVGPNTNTDTDVDAGTDTDTDTQIQIQMKIQMQV